MNNNLEGIVMLGKSMAGIRSKHVTLGYIKSTLLDYNYSIATIHNDENGNTLIDADETISAYVLKETYEKYPDILNDGAQGEIGVTVSEKEKPAKSIAILTKNCTLNSEVSASFVGE